MSRDLDVTLAAGVVGFDRLMAEDGEAANDVRREFWLVVDDQMDRNNGNRLVDVVAVMNAKVGASFPSAMDAVCCAIGLQRDFFSKGETVPILRQAVVRVGVNHDDYHSVLENLSGPGDVHISRTVYEEVKSHLEQQPDAKADPEDRALSYREVRRIWDELSPAESSVVKISAVALAGPCGYPAPTITPSTEKNSLIHRIMAFLDRRLSGLLNRDGSS